MLKRIGVLVLILLLFCVGVLAHNNSRLRKINWRLRDRIHATHLMVTDTNLTGQTLLAQAYTGHVLEKAGMFGEGHPVFFGIFFDSTESERSVTKGDTMLLLDQRFAPHRAELENSIGVQCEGKLYRIKDGELMDACNANVGN